MNTRMLRKGVPALCSQSLQGKGVGGKVFEVKHLVEAFFEVESLSWRAALVWLRGGRRWEVFGACVQSGFFVIFSKGCPSHKCDYFCGNFQRPGVVERTRVRDPLGRPCWAPQKWAPGLKPHSTSRVAMKGRSFTNHGEGPSFTPAPSGARRLELESCALWTTGAAYLFADGVRLKVKRPGPTFSSKSRVRPYLAPGGSSRGP